MRPSKNDQRGLTLIELVVAIGIGAVVISGAFTFWVRYQTSIHYQKTVVEGAAQIKELQALLNRFWIVRQPMMDPLTGNFIPFNDAYTGYDKGTCPIGKDCSAMKLTINRPSGAVDVVSFTTMCQAFTGPAAPVLNAIDFMAGGDPNAAAVLPTCLPCGKGTRPVVHVHQSSPVQDWWFPHDAAPGQISHKQDVLGMSACFKHLAGTGTLNLDIRASWLDQKGTGVKANIRYGSLPFNDSSNVVSIPSH